MSFIDLPGNLEDELKTIGSGEEGPQPGTESPPLQESMGLAGDEQKQSEPAPEPDERGKLREELSNLQAALREERDKRRGVEDITRRVLDHYEQAQAKATQPQAPPEDDYSDIPEEYRDMAPIIERLVERRVNPYVQAIAPFINQSNQATYARQMLEAWNMEASKYHQQVPDFGDAMNYYKERLRAKADYVSNGNPQMAAQYFESQIMAAAQYTPEQLYNYITQFEGYQKPQQPAGQPPPPQQAAAPKAPVPRSMASVPGNTGSSPNSLKARADKILSASYDELLKMNPKEMEDILRDMQ